MSVLCWKPPPSRGARLSKLCSPYTPRNWDRALALAAGLALKRRSFLRSLLPRRSLPRLEVGGFHPRAGHTYSGTALSLTKNREKNSEFFLESGFSGRISQFSKNNSE